MTRAFQFLFFSVLLLTISSFSPAHAQVPIDSRMSGSWYDPAHDGEGFVLEVLEGNKAAVYWFTYDEDGGQRWFFGSGSTLNDTLVVDTLLVSSGAVFGERFDPDDVIYEEVGNLTIKWTDCSTATATYTVNGTQGQQALSRLTTVAGLGCETSATAPSPMSGSWFDQTHNGEGLVIEILDDGRALVYWFSYDASGRQAWFFGLGEQDGSSFSVSEMYITSGGRFGPEFDPQQVQHLPAAPGRDR